MMMMMMHIARYLGLGQLVIGLMRTRMYDTTGGKTHPAETSGRPTILKKSTIEFLFYYPHVESSHCIIYALITS